ncbi:MAG: lipid-A-disaccharide synthase [Acidobacteria bacterium]|nr:lipid-A-disaccharide synthase [Acidobacteriota bacterium]
MILAGEASGEHHGAELIRALRRRYPQVAFEVFGSGGAQMRQAGVEVLVDVKDVGIIGPVEIARAWRKIYRAFCQLRDAARQRQPDAVILIDWPEFNLWLVRSLKRAGLPTIYYISPQIWAWRQYRLRTIKRHVDKMIVILPFEVEFYRRSGMEVEFVGHPLLDSVRVTKDRFTFCAQHQLDPQRRIVSLLPGSRRSEVHHILPVMIEAIVRLRSTGDQFVIPLAPTISRAFAESLIGNALGDLDLRVVQNDTYNALAHSELAVVTSGTATLEAALLETPLIVVYRSSALNYRLIRPLIHLDTFGMVNLIAGEKIVPELIQHDMTPERLAETVIDLLRDEPNRMTIKQRLKQVKQRLGEGNAADRAAEIVMDTIHKQRRDLGHQAN